MKAPIPVITDVRGLVSRQSGQVFGRRPLSAIRGVVIHQELGVGDVYSVARYHTSRECHIAPGKGCPSICYTYFVDTDGSIQWCNDLEDVTWSQGGGTPPFPTTKANTNYLAICFRGDFTGPDHVGKSEPTAAQIASLGKVWRWLRDMFDLPGEALFGHCDFGKPACPGDTLMAEVKRLREEPAALSAVTPETVEDWQRALVGLGYDLGKSGPEENGVDGDWGSKSTAALLAFQTSAGIPRSGGRDEWTARKIAEAMVSAKLSKLGTKAPSARRRKSGP